MKLVMRVVLFVAAVVALVLESTPAFAQQAQAGRTVAITATAPSAIGVLWHVTDSIAVRPELGLSRVSTESKNTPSGTGAPPATITTSSSWTISSGGSVLFYMAKRDNLRPYLSPRLTFGRASNSSSTSTTSTPITSYTLGGSVGAQYDVSNRFSVFGEVGLNYGWQNTNTTSGTTTFTNSTKVFGTGSRIGVAIYF